MNDSATLHINGKDFTMPVLTGTENEKAIDISKLRSDAGCITLDQGYGNTGSCRSNICYIDGEKGILRYRGIPIEQLAQHSRFIEAAYLLIWGELPTAEKLAHFSELLTDNAMLHENLKNHFEGFPWSSHPMPMLSAMINALGCYHRDLGEVEHFEVEDFEQLAARLISKVRTIAAFSYKMSRGEPFVYPSPTRRYVSNFLHMMFSLPHKEYESVPEVARALDLILMLHADHEQNCSTSTVRMVASAGANLFASISAGICALWGRLHGGANMAVIKMLEEIYQGGMDGKKVIEMAKDKENPFRLMGFGHRVYKNYDPRARILKQACDSLFQKMNYKDPLLDIAMELEGAALEDDYFQERNLYPNVDFYSGIILKAIGIPTNMFTVIFAIGRLPGWIAHWKEATFDDPNTRICRPRQVYMGYTERDYVPIEKRGT